MFVKLTKLLNFFSIHYVVTPTREGALFSLLDKMFYRGMFGDERRGVTDGRGNFFIGR